MAKSQVSRHEVTGRGYARPVVIAVAFALVASGCSAAAEDGAADAKPVLRIGLAYPLSGANGTFAIPMAKAAELSAGVVNQALSDAKANFTIKFVGVEDTQGTPTGGVEAANKLIDVNKADVVVGEINSTVSIAIAQSATIPKGVVQIATGTGSPALSALKDNGLVYRTTPSDTEQVPALVQAAAKKFGSRAKINVGYSKDTFGEGIGLLFKDAWVKAGGTLAKSVSFDPNATSLESEAQAIASGNPDGYVLLSIPDAFAKLAPALVRAGGWSADKTVVNSGMRSAAQLNGISSKHMKGLTGVAPTASGAPAKQAFDTLMSTRAPDVKRGPYDPSAFDAVMVAFLASYAAKSTKGTDISSQMSKVSSAPGQKYTFEQLPEAIKALDAGQDIDYEGAWSSLELDQNGDPTANGWETWSFDGADVKSLEQFEIR